MTDTQKHVSYHNILSPLCAEMRPLRAGIIRLSTKDFLLSPLLNQILLLLEYVQLLSLLLLFCLTFTNAQELSLYTVVYTMARIFNAASWVSFSQLGSLEIFILCLIATLTILKFLLFGYIALAAGGKLIPSKPLVQIWKVIFWAQSRFLHLFATSFWLSAVYVVRITREQRSDSEFYGILIICALMVALEFAFSMYLNIYYLDILPSKHYLSAKQNVVEIVTLTQKMVIQTLIVAMNFVPLGNKWAFAAINIVTDVVRNHYFFNKLPLYNFGALKYQGSLLMIATSLSIACFIECAEASIDETSSRLGRLILMWIIISILSIRFSREYINPLRVGF